MGAVEGARERQRFRVGPLRVRGLGIKPQAERRTRSSLLLGADDRAWVAPLVTMIPPVQRRAEPERVNVPVQRDGAPRVDAGHVTPTDVDISCFTPPGTLPR
jgi:hypothetical protein